MISESGLWWFVRIATIISLNVNIRRYVCHSIDVRDLVILKDKMLNDIDIVVINKNLNDRGYGG